MGKNEAFSLKPLKDYFEALKGPSTQKSGLLTKFCKISAVRNDIISKIINEPRYQPRLHNLVNILAGILKCDRELPEAPKGGMVVKNIIMNLTGNNKELADMIIKLMEIGSSKMSIDPAKVNLAHLAIDNLYSDFFKKSSEAKSPK